MHLLRLQLSPRCSNWRVDGRGRRHRFRAAGHFVRIGRQQGLVRGVNGVGIGHGGDMQSHGKNLLPHLDRLQRVIA